jgi:Holliday junction resolvase-like predicted endonuclease
MTSVGLWQINKQGPRRLHVSDVGFERRLEEWIEQDPALLEQGLSIIGRQFGTEAGPIDLLGVDIQGRLIVIELKAGSLRRETIGQAFDYASCVATMAGVELRRKSEEYLQRHGGSLEDLSDELRVSLESEEEREVAIYLVGTGRAPGLERMVDFLGGRHSLPITVVTFEVFQLPDGQRIMVRELTESDSETSAPSSRSGRRTIEAVCRRADKAGIGEPFRRILQVAQEVDLYARPYEKSIMYTSPSMRTRMLFTVWGDTFPDGSIKAYLGPETFAEFYPVTPGAVRKALGEKGGRWWHLDAGAVEGMLKGLRQLLS